MNAEGSTKHFELFGLLLLPIIEALQGGACHVEFVRHAVGLAESVSGEHDWRTSHVEHSSQKRSNPGCRSQSRGFFCGHGEGLTLDPVDGSLNLRCHPTAKCDLERTPQAQAAGAMATSTERCPAAPSRGASNASINSCCSSVSRSSRASTSRSSLPR